MSSLLRVLAALLLSAPACVAFAVRGHGGDVVAAGVPATRLATTTKDNAVVSALAQPTTICGLTAAAYSVDDFEANSIPMGEGSFGKVLSIPRKTSQGETLTPTEARVLVDGGNRLAVKVAKEVKEEEMTSAIKSATREAALGLLVCSGVGCPAGSPFPAFLGTQNKGAGVPVALVTELVQGAELASVLAIDPKDTDKAAWTEFLDAHALPSPAPAALRNLDGVLAAAAGMALAVARLEEIGAVHHDMKPSNTMIGKGGVRVFDFGLTCLSKDSHEVNAAAGTATAFVASDGADGACKLACTGLSPGGTPGFYSPTKVGFLGGCRDRSQCTAEELRGVDLFAVGMSLMELLAANDAVAWPDYVLAPEDDTCVKIDGTDVEKKAKKVKLASVLPSLLSAYFSLDDARLDWAAAGPADAAGRRIFSYLATFGPHGRRRTSILGNAPPLSYFSTAPPEKKLIVPRCFSSSPTSGPSGLFNPQGIRSVEDLFLTLAAASAPPPALRPAPWTDGAAEEHLLSVPTQSRALKPLLDVVRKLLAYNSRRDGFANALDAVHAIDNVRKLLAEEAPLPASRRAVAALVAFRTKLACHATETAPRRARAQPLAQPQPQMQLQAAPALPQAQEELQCRAAAALALEQIAQRDKSPGASPRPNEYDVAMALHDCVLAASAEPPPPALLSKRAFGAIVGRQLCAVRPAQLGNPAVGGAAPPPAEPLVNQNGLAIATEKLPFALEEGVSATWAKRLFFLQCDVIGALDEPAGEGVWLHWAGGVSGMGYVEEVHDTSTPPGVNPAPYTCRKHYLSSVTGAACKALRLRHATPRSGGGNTRPREGLLKLYAAGNNNAGALRDAIDRVKTSRCGAGSAADNFRRLLAAATNHQQPQDWRNEWTATAYRKTAEEAAARAAAEREVQATMLQGFHSAGFGPRRF